MAISSVSANFKKIGEGIVDGYVESREHGANQRYNGAPVFISEYGGIAWGRQEGRNWGYGDAPKSKDEFIKRYELLTASLLDNPDLMGFCYTQLYDVEQEINGLYTYETVLGNEMSIPRIDAKYYDLITE